MHANTIAGAIFTVLAGSTCLTVSGCHGLTTDPGHSGAAAEDASGFSFAADYDLSGLPPAWYCVSQWSSDRNLERRGMELFAWRLFIGINWPVILDDDNAEQWKDKKLSELNKGKVTPRWNTWYAPEDIFEALKTSDCSSKGANLSGWKCNGDCLKNVLRGKVQVPEVPGVSLSGQPVYDQNGHVVQYQIMVNQSWCETIERAVKPGRNGRLDFEHGQCAHRGSSEFGDTYNLAGATEIKLAWKMLTEAEISSGRFLQRLASMPQTSAGAGARAITLGLVGFHIAHKSKDYSDWIWSTFEHVDNLAPAETPSGPSFNDPKCDESTCKPNTTMRVQVDGGSFCRTQIARIDPISLDVQKLNARVRAWLKANNTVLQYYQLIGVQYKPFSDRSKGLSPDPKRLRNSVIETYNVGSNTLHSGVKSDPCEINHNSELPTCMGCHVKASEQDFSFLPTQSLCNCEDKDKWIGDDGCERIGVVCPSNARARGDAGLSKE